MPQHIDVQGVGIIEFPDETQPEEIQKVLDENFGKKGKPPGMLETVGESALEGIGPGAAFLAASVPGAEAGALAGTAIAPFLGPLAPLAPIAGGIIGGMGLGIPAAMLASRELKAIATTIAPDTAGKFYQRLEEGQKENPWSAVLGSTLSLSPSAKLAPLKAAQIPLRAALGLGLGAAVPAITNQRLPTQQELVSGVAMSMFGEARWSKPHAPRPPASPEVREDRKSKFIELGKGRGLDVEFTQEPLPQSNDVINIIPGTTKAVVNESNFHEYLEQHVSKKVDDTTALKDLVEHEFKHSVTAPAKAKELWNNLSPYQQYLFKRTLEGPDFNNRKRTDEYYGGEFIRFHTQLLREKSASEYISSIPSEMRTSKFLTGIQNMVAWTRKNLGSNLSKEAMRRNQEILDEVDAKAEAVKEELKKGAPDARSQQEAAEVHGAMQPQPVEGARQVPSQEGGAGVQPQAEGVAQEAQVPLTIQKTRSDATIKDPPVAKDVPEGSIHPDSIVPAIRLINGDVVHGWINKDGTAATHPEIAKQYGITVEELDRKGWIRKDGRVFYEREPAAKGTQLPTNKKAGELHSTDKPKEAPPVAPTKGAQPLAPETGIGKPGVAAPVEPAKATISAAFPESKLNRLDELANKIGRRQGSLEDHLEYNKLSNELEEAERKAGGGEQPSEPLAMSLKHRSDRAEEVKGMSGDDLVKSFPHGMNPENWEIGETSSPEEVSKLKDHLSDVESKLSTLKEKLTGGKATLDQMKEFQTLASKRQYFSEAIQAAPKEVGGGGRVFIGAEERAKSREALAMSLKTGELTEEQKLSRSIISAIGGVGKDPEKLAMAQDAFNQITALPKEKWNEALTDFHFKWKAKEIADAQKEIEQNGPSLEDVAKHMGIPLESLNLGAAIEKMFSSVDRQGAYRSALGELNQAITPIAAPSDAGRPKILPAGGEAVSTAVRPEYNAPNYNKWWNEFKIDHPHIPEWAAKEIWIDAAHDVLNNASGERIKELLKAARMEKRFLGNLPAPQPGEADPRRIIPDADPQPILIEMSKAPDPKQSVKFRKFLAARDLTPEEGMEVLKQLDAKLTEEINQRAAEVGTGQEITGPAGKKLSWATGTREAMTEGEKSDLARNWREGRAQNQKRRESAIDALAEWLTEPATAVKQDPIRRTIGLEDIWWEMRGSKKGSYASYSQREGENRSFLAKALARGSVKGKTASKISRMVAVVVDKETGDYHAVSVYVKDKLPRIYNPDAPVGSKEGNFIDLNQLLSIYRVSSSFMVRDPLYRLHQAWLTEKGGKTGEQKYNEEIGAVARIKEDASEEQWHEYLQEKKSERAAEEKEQFEQRFAEEEPGEGEVEEAPTPSIRSEMESDRARKVYEAAYEASDPDSIKRKKPIPVESQIAIDAWMKGGVGRGPLGLFETDLRSLAQHSLTANEAESLHSILTELDIKSGYDFERLLEKSETALGIVRPEEQRAGLADVIRYKRTPVTMSERLGGDDIAALYGISKIVNRIHGEMLRSPTEQRRISGLKKAAMEGKKPDADPLPNAEYWDMNAAEKAYYDALSAQRYRAVLKAFDKLYEITNEAKSVKAGPAKGPAGEFSPSPESRAFAQRALDRYGDTARRSVEQAALSERLAAESRERSISGERELLGRTGRKPEQVMSDRTLFGLTPSYRGQQRFPTPVGMPPEMLPAGSRPTPQAPPPKGAFPLPGVPTSPGRGVFNVPKGSGGTVEMQLGGKKFTGLPPETIPERGTPVGHGQDRGFIPSAPSRHELLGGKPPFPGQDPLAMTLKGYGPARRYQEEMVGQGRAMPRPEADEPPVSKEKQIAEGRDLVASGKINPVKEMARYEAVEAKEKDSGYISLNSQKAFRYWGYHLQEMADAAYDNNPKSREAKGFAELSDQWQRRIEKSSGKVFARGGHLLQGWNQIGPNDMQSTNFIKRYLKKVRAKEKGVDEDEYELDDEDIAVADSIARSSKKAQSAKELLEVEMGEESSKALDPELDEGNKQKVSQFDKYRKSAREKAAGLLKKNKPSSAAMAMKGEGGELPKLDSETEDILGNLGMDVMAELSKSNDLTDARWLQEMNKVLSSDEVQRPDLEPYLPHIRAVSEVIRDTAINNYVGTGDSVKDARHIFTRKRPPIDQSIQAIRRAMEADPTGKKISPAEAYHVWNYLKQRFFNKDSPSHTLDFNVIRSKATQELGIKDDSGKIEPGKEYSQLRLFRAMSSNRTMRKLSEDLIKSVRDEARIKGEAMNWLKNQQYPGWLRTMRLFPRLFFLDKIAGHSLVPMITHAPTMLFNPRAWSVYFGTFKNGKWQPGAWQHMYRMTFGTMGEGRIKGADYHRLMMDEMVNDDYFEFAKQAGLQHDPFKHTDDYQVEGLKRVFGGKLNWLVEGRGFDALKTFRFAMWKKWFLSLPEHLQNKESASLIADSVNHATGIIKSSLGKFSEPLAWTMFAPKLAFSRFAMIKDVVKAVDIARKWRTASLEERAWAKSELMQKASIVAWYYGMLALNQGFLKMSGSDQDINVTDPKKPDFMQFKVAGFKVGVASPIMGIVKLVADSAHDAFGERTKFEKLTPRQKALFATAMKYARGKSSPIASFAVDAATAQNYATRPIGFLPWSEKLSRRQRLKGETPYSLGEYLSETFAPIPLEEAFKNVFKQGGMSEIEASELLRTLIIAGGMSATGARITEQDQ